MRKTWSCLVALAVTTAMSTACSSSDSTPGSTQTTPPPVLGEAPSQLTPMQEQASKEWLVRIAAQADEPFCWRQSEGRGAGVPLSTCGSGERSGALCYPTCHSGFDGVGPICWERCRSGYVDDGALCRKDPKIVLKKSYGRGAGYVSEALCKKSNASCEPNGLLYYPTCAAGYKAAGCCVCSEICPAGYTDDGATCRKDGGIYAKDSYGRGAGTPLQCRDGEDQSGALCYPACKPTYEGIGPVCWGSCPSTQPFACAAGCAQNEVKCAEATLEMVIAPIELVENILGFVFTGGLANEAKAVAKAAVKTAVKTGGKVAARTAVRSSDLFNRLLVRLTSLAQRKLVAEMAEETAKSFIEGVAENIVVASLSHDDLEMTELLIDLDPTGVAAVIAAFVHPVCEADQPPDLAALAKASVLLPTNLALRHPVTLSSTDPRSTAAAAVDGALGPSFATTQEQDEPTLRVDLGQESWVGSVIITRDPNVELSNFEVVLTDASGFILDRTSVMGAVGEVSVLKFSHPARFVTLRRLTRSVLSIAELEVHVSPQASTFGAATYLNVAQGMPTSQSSTVSPTRAAENAVDGDLSTGFVTLSEDRPSWQVDFGRVAAIEEVVLYPRGTDALPTDYDVVLLGEDGQREVMRAGFHGPQKRPNAIRMGPKGRFLKIELTKPGPLALGEVAAYALVPNLALGRATMQSSDASARSLAALATDGSTVGTSTATKSQAGAYWEVDLGRSRPISRVRIWDAMPGGLSNGKVTFIDDIQECVSMAGRKICHARPAVSGSIPIQEALSPGAVLAFDGRARIVRIQLNDVGALKLSEVQVF